MRKSMRTYSARKEDHPHKDRKWFVVDAKDKVLGRVAVQVANKLRGKDMPTYTPHVDTGSFVVIINAGKIKLTGSKIDQKIYHRHTGYFGGLKSATAREMLEKKPEDVIKKAIVGMLPKSRLGRAIVDKLKIYAGPEHPHAAQKPVPLEV